MNVVRIAAYNLTRKVRTRLTSIVDLTQPLLHFPYSVSRWNNLLQFRFQRRDSGILCKVATRKTLLVSLFWSTFLSVVAQSHNLLDYYVQCQCAVKVSSIEQFAEELAENTSTALLLSCTFRILSHTPKIQPNNPHWTDYVQGTEHSKRPKRHTGTELVLFSCGLYESCEFKSRRIVVYFRSFGQHKRFRFLMNCIQRPHPRHPACLILLALRQFRLPNRKKGSVGAWLTRSFFPALQRQQKFYEI